MRELQIHFQGPLSVEGGLQRAEGELHWLEGLEGGTQGFQEVFLEEKGLIQAMGLPLMRFEPSISELSNYTPPRVHDEGYHGTYIFYVPALDIQ